MAESSAQIRMPVYRQKKEDYKFKFLDWDDPEKDYTNFLQSLKTDYSDSTFEYLYDREYFFDTL